jgi:hypothetical protein
LRRSGREYWSWGGSKLARWKGYRGGKAGRNRCPVRRMSRMGLNNIQIRINGAAFVRNIGHISVVIVGCVSDMLGSTVR